MARISVRALPTQVNRRVRSIPIFVQLVAGLLPTDLSLQVSKSWNQVSLYTVNGAIYYEIISAPAFQYRMFLQVGNVPVEDFAVDLFAPAGSRQATEILFTLIETANPISTSGQYTIGMAPDEPTSISTERVGIFSDDFDRTFQRIAGQGTRTSLASRLRQRRRPPQAFST